MLQAKAGTETRLPSTTASEPAMLLTKNIQLASKCVSDLQPIVYGSCNSSAQQNRRHSACKREGNCCVDKEFTFCNSCPAASAFAKSATEPCTPPHWQSHMPVRTAAQQHWNNSLPEHAILAIATARGMSSGHPGSWHMCTPGSAAFVLEDSGSQCCAGDLQC